MEGVIAGFQELVPWLFPVTDSAVVTKDSYLLGTFEILGLDIDSVDDGYVDAIYSRLDRLYCALNTMHESVIWLTMMRYPSSSLRREYFRNIGSQELFNLHRRNMEQYAKFRMRSFITIGIGPVRGAEKFLVNVGNLVQEGNSLFGAIWHSLRASMSSRYAFAYKHEQLLRGVEDLEQMLLHVESQVPELGLRRLRGKEFFGFLRAFVSDVNTPDDVLELDIENSVQFLDAKLPDAEVVVGGDVMRLGGKYLAALSLKEWPEVTTPDLVRAVMMEPSELVFSFAFRMLPFEEGKKTLLRIRQYAEVTQFRLISYLMAMFRGEGEPPEHRADALARQDAQEAIAAEQAHAARDIGIGYGNLTVVVYGRSEEDVQDRALRLRKRLSLYAPGVVQERVHLVSAYSAILPGQIYEPVRWSLLTSRNLSDATWFLLPYGGEEYNEHFSKQLKEPSPCLAVLPTEWQTKYHFNFHERTSLGHSLVIGPARSGKSVMVNFLLSQFLKYSPCNVIIFDKDKSCKINTMLHGGTYYEVNVEHPIAMNPMALVRDQRHHSFLVEWVVTLLRIRGHVATSEEIKKIQSALEELKASGAEEQHRLLYFVHLLPSVLRSHLELYVEDGQYGYMFDNPVDEFSLHDMTCIEMGDLMRIPAIAVPFMDYAFYRIMDMLEANRAAGARANPTLIYLEECWFLLENEYFAERVRDWLKTLAKMNAAVIMTTQSMDDMVTANPKVFSAIRDNIPTKILLPNPKAKTETARKVYRDYFGVDDYCIGRIVDAIPNRDYLVVKSDHVKMLWYRFTKDQLLYLRSDSAALSIFEEEYAKGPGWEGRYKRRVLEEL